MLSKKSTVLPFIVATLSCVGAVAQEPMNCLYIVLDAFHADKSSLYGYPKPTTPNIDRWAKKGIVFDNAVSQFQSTSGSTWSYLNGLYPYHSESIFPMRDDDVPLAEVFRLNGYRTGGFSDNPWVNDTTGMERGFGHFRYHAFNTPMNFAPKRATSDDLRLKRDKISKVLFDELDTWVDEESKKPWFGYVHTLRPHNPYPSQEPFLSEFVDTSEVPDDEDVRDYFFRLENEFYKKYYKNGWSPELFEELIILHNLYLSNIAYIDDLLGTLLDSMAESGKLDNTLIIITSDHGEGFAEHWKISHGERTPYQEFHHVPLVIIPPKSMKVKTGRRAPVVELVDLFATLTDTFQLADEQLRHGQSLLPLMKSTKFPTDVVSYAQSEYQLAVYRNDVKLIYKIRDRWGKSNGEAFLVDQPNLLFDLSADPGEQENLIDQHPDTDLLIGLAKQYLVKQAENDAVAAPELSDEEVELLETLGYLQ
jgi:arylsulfatase A-like enzyme